MGSIPESINLLFYICWYTFTVPSSHTENETYLKNIVCQFSYIIQDQFKIFYWDSLCLISLEKNGLNFYIFCVCPLVSGSG